LAAVASAGDCAIAVRAHEGEAALPFGVVAAMLRAALAAGRGAGLEAVPGHWRAEAARLLPELGGEAAPGDSVGAQQRLHEGLAQVTVALLAGGDPSVLFIDDLHLADTASLAMLAYLVRRLGERPLLIVAAWRPEETGPEHARLRRLASRVVRLGRLSRDDVDRLAAAAGMEQYGERLWAETEGLPLFVVEYLAALEDPQGREDLPRGVRELLLSRLNGVSEAASQLLTAAAAIGRSFDLDTLRVASGRGEEETVAGIEELVGRGLIVE